MTTFAILALALAGLGVYLAYNNPKLGAAILVGAAIFTLMWLIGEDKPTRPTDPAQSTFSSTPADPAHTPTSDSQAGPGQYAEVSPEPSPSSNH
ncbi:hypothetical protein [Streptomyces sp. NPDC057280]|uniref:hypothetical protein n=1 Tax=Streptomyces sp. NPDC057280 TaxID=3346081 RepID=UPI00362B4879